MAPFSESTAEKVKRLRQELDEVRRELAEAEAELNSQLEDVQAFEFRFEAHVGQLLDQLATLESEVDSYLTRIKLMRHQQSFANSDAAFDPVEEQFRQTWQQSSETAVSKPPPPPPAATQAQLKKMYRQLARQFHPDLALDEADRQYRTDKMAAINDAYQAQSMVELMALAEELEAHQSQRQTEQPPDKEMAQALQEEIERCRRRLRSLDNELQNLPNRSMVDLALKVKLAQREGRDLLAEMAEELERKIARKTAERDMLRTQFNNL
ncbi:DnaJ domain-containing protein [Candidatus Leptofilum sp.]|uniref:DnaJ domain-containing protein n=1 Tax=Candidatus Leptofilum sp. TaxID=3241576 RepID=UPI003B5A7729